MSESAQQLSINTSIWIFITITLLVSPLPSSIVLYFPFLYSRVRRPFLLVLPGSSTGFLKTFLYDRKIQLHKFKGKQSIIKKRKSVSEVAKEVNNFDEKLSIQCTKAKIQLLWKNLYSNSVCSLITKEAFTSVCFIIFYHTMCCEGL